MLHTTSADAVGILYQKDPSRHMSSDRTSPYSMKRAIPHSSHSGSPNKLIEILEPDTSGQASGLDASTPSIPRFVSEHRADSPPTSPGNIGAVREGLGSLNRWSQSTASSKSPPRYIGRHRGSSRVVDFDDLHSPKDHVIPTRNIPFQHSHQAVDISMNPSDRLPENHTAGLFGSTRPESGVQPTFSTNITNTVPSRSAHAFTESISTSASLFYDPWTKGQDLGMNSSEVDTSSHCASPVSQLHNQEMATNSSPTEENPFLFADEEKNKGKHQRGQSQKTMLSKALQKANTAVLLDNAANFEGAMDAYNDACYLLQLVMLRSNGGEDEKLKLQEIVCLPLIITRLRISLLWTNSPSVIPT